jgi:two-component system sensor histidine kinase AlgZ
MQPIIRHNAIRLELPDFRNLGTILRIVLAVNAMTAVAALVKAPQIELWTAQWLDMTALAEPYLIVELAILYTLAPWLFRQTPSMSAFVIAAITVLVGLGLHALIGRPYSDSPFALVRHLVLALCTFGVLLSISTFGRKRCRRRSPSPGCRRSRRGSARISCSTASMRCCRSSGRSRSGPKPHCSTWRTFSAC